MAARLVILPEHDCSYIPGRIATNRAFYASMMPASVYHRFMNAGFRRSGRVVYQPICHGCRKCLMARVDVSRFEPSKSQRRCWRRNQDLQIDLGLPVASDEKFDLYRRYQLHWHAKADAEDRAGFESFLYDSPVDTLEYTYRDPTGKLLAVGICDRAVESLSTVYFYYDPDFSTRGLGTFSALHELAQSRELKIPYYYLGYWISGCPTMEYKTNFQPCQILHPDGVWRDAAAK